MVNMAQDSPRYSSHSNRHLDYDLPLKPHAPSSSHRSQSNHRSRRSLSSEAEAARAKREERIERAVERAVARRAEREAKLLGTSDVESVARRLREQREEAARWREKEQAKRRISKDRARREAGGLGTSSPPLSSHRKSRGNSTDWEPALSGWLDKRRDERRKTNISSALRSGSGSSHGRDSGSIVSALRATSHGSSTRHQGSISSRGRATSSSRGRSTRNDDDSATVATEVSSRSLVSSGSVGQKIRSLSFRKSNSKTSDDRIMAKEEGAARERSQSHRSSKKKNCSSFHRHSKGSQVDDDLDNGSIKSGRSSRSGLSLKSKSAKSSKNKSKRKGDDDVSLKSGRSSRSLLSKSRGSKDNDTSVKSGRSSRSLRSKGNGKKRDDDAPHKLSQSNRSKNDVKISRHERYGSGTRERLDSKELFPAFFSDGDKKASPNNGSSLEKEIVRLKLEIAEARAGEEKERRRAREAAGVNDRLRAKYQQQKDLAQEAKQGVGRLNKELERLRRLKAKVAPQIQESRIKAWNRRRTSTASRPTATPGSRQHSDGSARQSYGSGASVASMSSWSLGESLHSVRRVFERAEQAIADLEEETLDCL